MPEPIGQQRDIREERIEFLESLLLDIAFMADGHKASRLYIDNENVALVNIRNMAAFELGMEDELLAQGTLFATPKA